MIKGIGLSKRATILLLGSVALAAGCGGEGSPKPDGAASGNEPRKPQEVVIPVEVGSTMRGSISAYFETFSRVEAEASVEVAAEGTGKCTGVYVEEGDHVTKGQVLAELDKAEAAAQLRQTEVQTCQQKADYERAKRAYEQGLMPKADYDAARFAYEQGQANLEAQQVQFDNLTVRAPIDGVVSQRSVQTGQLISSGSPVFSIVDPDTFKLVINPPEKDLSRLHVGQTAQVRIDALQGQVFEARVARINPSVDPASGTIKVTLEFPKEARDNLLESAFARVNLVMETREDALLLPKDTVIEENAQEYVFVVREQPVVTSDRETPLAESASGERRDGGVVEAATDDEEEGEKAAPRYIAERVEVTTGLEDRQHVEILEGITEDSVVVTTGQFNLKDGALVRITNAEAEIMANLDLSPEEALKRAKEKRGDEEGVRRRRFDRPM